jgi:hypothetical protein
MIAPLYFNPQGSFDMNKPLPQSDQKGAALPIRHMPYLLAKIGWGKTDLTIKQKVRRTLRVSHCTRPAAHSESSPYPAFQYLEPL